MWIQSPYRRKTGYIPYISYAVVWAAAAFLVPLPSFAAVTISEIMYDPAGADDGHEWVEVYNDGSSVDLTDWKLFEGGTNHGIASYAGGDTLPAGGYAVIVDNPQKFMVDNPGFSGQVYDTAFSGGLNNTNGETLTLRNDSLVDIDTVTYSPAIGAGGDGNSLQRIGGSWTASVATPGTGSGTTGGSSTSQNQTSQNSSSSSNSSQSASTTSPGTSFPVDPKVFVSAGNDRTVVAGASTVFKAQVTGLKEEVIPDARIVWSFGNGERKEGGNVLYAFPYPGRYAVVADAASGYYSATARLTVIAVPAQVAVAKVTDEFVEITNRSNLELNLGMWGLSADGKVFTFPPDTIIFPNESVAISNIATGLQPSSPSAVSLLYPNGMVATSYGSELIMARSSAQSGGLSGDDTEPSRNAVRTDTSSQPRNLLAAPAAAAGSTSMPFSDSFGILPWILGLVAVTGIGAGATLLIRKGGSTKTGYTIIEEP